MYQSVIIKNHAKKKLEGGGLWLTKGDIVGRAPSFPCIVKVIDKSRKMIGHAFCSPKSKIFLRVFSGPGEKVDKEFWRRKIREAYSRRLFLEPETNSYRVVYAESDGIPSVVIDKYNDIWSVQITSAGAEIIKNDLFDIIIEDYQPASIVEKNDSSSRIKEGLPAIEKVVYGQKNCTEVREGEQRFWLDLIYGQKTGAYLDYRRIRMKARELAYGYCLDAFCYQGWFACQIAGKVDLVIAVDSSEGAISAAGKNAKINGHKNIEFVRADVFDYLKGCMKEFDFIHLDPPSFVKRYDRLRPAILGYERLINDALGRLKPDGIILVSSCSHHISERILEEAVINCLDKRGVTGEIIFRGIQDRDHPLLKGFPEALYLKAVAVRLEG